MTEYLMATLASALVAIFLLGLVLSMMEAF